MEVSTIIAIIAYSILGLIAIVAAVSSVVTTKQKEASIIERFGKFKGIRRPGLSFKAPFIDKVSYR